MTNIKITNEAYEKLKDIKNRLSLPFTGAIQYLTAEYLFNLPSDYKQYLKAGPVDAILKQAFHNDKIHKISLSRNARISIIDEKNWMVTDGWKRCRIEDAGKKLKIYRF